ncbi:MAG: gamma carbonic anhydrase family protein [Planctomycetota bacterium]|nr:gamma carbonic anhydrase family protein [Planctomycetota bacterium]
MTAEDPPIAPNDYQHRSIPGIPVDLDIGAGFHQVDGWFHAHSATIVGDVRIGSGCGIWYGAVLRGDDAPIILGERVNVQDQSVLHADPGKALVIGDDVTIGHGAIVHCISIGAGSLIGMGSVLLEDVEVGAGSLIAAGAVVSPGSKIEPGSLVVGVPGRTIRTVSDEERSAFFSSAAKYAKNAVAFQQRYGERSR